MVKHKHHITLGKETKNTHFQVEKLQFEKDFEIFMNDAALNTTMDDTRGIDVLMLILVFISSY